MTRVSMVPPPKDDPVLMAELERVGLNGDSIYNHRPSISVRLRDFYNSLAHEGTLPRRLQEIIRLRIAFHNQCKRCITVRYNEAIEDGVTEELVCSLEKPEEAPDLTDAERAALRFADRFATGHLSIDDAAYDDLRQYYSEAELFEIGLNCATCVGFGRLAATWFDSGDVPEAMFLQDEKGWAPWNVKERVVVP